MNDSNNAHPAYKMAFIDLDHTLLGPDRTVSPANHAALRRLKDAGVQTVVTSGRHHRNILGFSDLGPQDWIISAQGSIVRNGRTHEALLETTLAPEQVRRIVKRALDFDVCVIAYHHDGAFASKESHWREVYERDALWPAKVVDFNTLLPTGFQKLTWLDHPERIIELEKHLRGEFSDQNHLVITEPYILEFLVKGANKASGAEALTAKLGIDRAQTLAFGDGNNDVELLNWAGLSVAMRHGSESARNAARLVSPPAPPEDAFAAAVDLVLSA
jgi:Cof subfamily protein (haloacid dehalogenase superfamily)